VFFFFSFSGRSVFIYIMQSTEVGTRYDRRAEGRQQSGLTNRDTREHSIDDDRIR